MKKINGFLKCLLCIILVLTMMFSVITIAGASTKAALELADISALYSQYLNPTAEEKETYPNGSMMLPINTAEMYMQSVYKIHIFRQGGTKGTAKITIKTIDMTAEYGNDYRIYTDINSMSSPVNGQANPYYGIQNESFIPIVTQTTTEYLTEETNKKLNLTQNDLSKENDKNLLEKMPTSSSVDLTFEDGENDKCIYVETLQSEKITDDKTFMISLCNPLNCKIGGDTTSSFTIKETREKPETYVQITNEKVGINSEKVYVKVQRAGNLGGITRFHFNTLSGTAKAPDNYDAVSLDLSFMPGMTEIKVPVNIYPGIVNNTYFSAVISDVENAKVLNNKSKITFTDTAEDSKEHKNNYTFNSISKNTSSSQIIQTANTNKSTDIAESSANKDITSSGNTDYRSTKKRGVIYLDMNEFSMDDNYVRCKGTTRDKNKEQIRFQTDHGFSFYRHVTGIVSNSNIDFTGADFVHVCHDHMFGSMSNDSASVAIGDGSPITSDPGAGWMNSLQSEGRGTTWSMVNISQSNLEKQFTIGDKWSNGPHKLYFTIQRIAVPGDCGLNLQCRGDGQDLKSSTYIQLKKYNINILNADPFNLYVNGNPTNVQVVKNVEMIDPGASSSSPQSRVTQCDIYRDETATIIPAIDDTYRNYVTFKGVYICDPNNYDNHSSLISLSNSAFTLTPNILQNYKNYIKDKKIVIKPVYELKKANIQIENSSNPNDITFSANMSTCTGEIKQNNETIGTISWTKPRNDGSYYVGDEIVFTSEISYGGYSTTYSVRSATTKEGLPSAQIVTYDNGQTRQMIPVKNIYDSITPNIVAKDAETKLIIKNRNFGDFSGKNSKFDKINDDGSSTITGYQTPNKTDVLFSSYKVGQILQLTAKPISGYRAKWQYRDSATHQIKTYFGNAFYFILQNPYYTADNVITLTFEKASTKEFIINGKTKIQKCTIVHPHTDTDIYEDCPNALVMLDGFSSMSDGKGNFTLYKDANASIKENAKLNIGDNETHRALIFFNNKYYVTDIDLSKTVQHDNQCIVDIKLKWLNSGARPTSIVAYNDEGVIYNDTITLIKTKPVQFDLQFTRENEDSSKPINMAKWTIENAKSNVKQTYDLDIDVNLNFSHFATVISEVASHGDKLKVELLNKSYDEKSNPVYKSYGKYDTGYNFVATAIEETITYFPDLGAYSKASKGIDEDENAETMAQPIPCFGPISPMISLFGFKPILSTKPIGKDTQGRDLFSIQIGLSFGEIKDKCSQDDPNFKKKTYKEQLEDMKNKIRNLDRAYNTHPGVPNFGGGRAINMNTSVNISFSITFCFQANYYINKRTGEWCFTNAMAIFGGGGSIRVSIPFVVLMVPCFGFFEFSANVNFYIGTFPDKVDKEGKSVYLTLKELNKRNLSKFQGVMQLAPSISFGLGIGIDGLISASGHLDNNFDFQMAESFSNGIGKYSLAGGVKLEFLFFSKDWGGNITSATMYDKTKRNSLDSIYNSEDLMATTKLGDMEIDETPITKAELASVLKTKNGKDTILDTSVNIDSTKISKLTENEYFITEYSSKSNNIQHILNYTIYDKENGSHSEMTSVLDKAYIDADRPNSKIDKNLVNKLKDCIDSEVSLVDTGKDIMLLWDKNVTTSDNNLEQLLSIDVYSIMFNKEGKYFHDLSLIPSPVSNDKNVLYSPKAAYNKELDVIQVFYQAIDFSDVTLETSIKDLEKKNTSLFTTSKKLSGDEKWNTPTKINTKNKRINYFDCIAYEDKVYLTYVSTDKDGFTLESLGDAEYNSDYFDASKFNTVNAMYLNEYSFNDGAVSKINTIQLTDENNVVANPKFARIKNKDIDNVLVFYKSNGKYAYQNINTLISNGTYVDKDGNIRVIKDMMKPSYLDNNYDHTVNDDLIIKYNENGYIYAFWTVSEGKQQQIWSSNFTIDEIKTITETSVLDEDGKQVYDEHGKAVMKKLDTPIKYMTGFWSGKNYLTTGGLGETDIGMYKKALDAIVEDDGNVTVVSSSNDYEFIPSEENPERGEWVEINPALAVSEYNTDSEFKLSEEDYQFNLSTIYPLEGEEVEITMNATNTGIDAGRDVKFNLYVNDTLYSTETLDIFETNTFKEVKTSFIMPEDADPSQIKLYYTITENGIEKAKSITKSFRKDANVVLNNASIIPISLINEHINDSSATFALAVEVWNTGNKEYQGGDIVRFVNSDARVAANINDNDETNDLDYPYYTSFGKTTVPPLEVGEKETLYFLSEGVPKSIFEINPGQDSANLEFILEGKEDKDWKTLYANEKYTLLSSLNVGLTQTPKLYEPTEINADDMNVFIGAPSKISYSLSPIGETYDTKVQFHSSDETIATVDETGTVTAFKEGKVKITLTAGNLKKEIFITAENPYGDANRDGKITISDVTTIQMYLAKLIPESKIDIKKANVNGDFNKDKSPRVTIISATIIQEFLAKMIDTFPVCK